VASIPEGTFYAIVRGLFIPVFSLLLPPLLTKQSLEQLKAGEWGVTHVAEAWRPRLDEVSPNHAVEAAFINMDL
jgi:hypothetical protein